MCTQTEAYAKDLICPVLNGAGYEEPSTATSCVFLRQVAARAALMTGNRAGKPNALGWVADDMAMHYNSPFERLPSALPACARPGR